MKLAAQALTDRVASAANEQAAEPREWFSAAELAELRLPGLPADKRAINRRARDERWASKVSPDGELLVRERKARGGGSEFHMSLLPGPARVDLVRRGLLAAEPSQDEAKTPLRGSWAWFEQQPAAVREEAARRLHILNETALLEEAGATASAAVGEQASANGVSPATIWNWKSLVDGIAQANWLPALAPRRKGGGQRAQMPADLWAMLKSDWLRPEQPSLSSCWARITKIADSRGIQLPSERSIRRRLERELDPRVVTLGRKGKEALETATPDVRRTLEGLHALDIVNIDGHTFDVFVTHPETGKPVRPVMVAIQDIYSRKMLAWRLDLSENVLATRLAFADLFREYGIPRECLLDNSRTFASKALTAGAATRYRFKTIAEEPAGLLVSLGIKVRFAQVYHGQSKPIERAFRDLCDHIARGPECAGAYTGNSPVNKPENYGKRAIPWDEFEGIVERGIADHNARLGRRAGVCRGRSFDQTFAESYAEATIRKATPEQLRMALLAAERKRLSKRNGEIKLYENRYWSPECSAHRGEMVTVRFDPDNLHQSIHVYDREGRYLAEAALLQDSGFGDVAGAIATGKRKKEQRRAVRAGLEAEREMSAADIAAAQRALAADRQKNTAPRPLKAGAVRLVHHSKTAAAMKIVDQIEDQRAASDDRFFTALGKLRAVD
ncbi:transposase [Aurantiacibacter xanthus]|uniref:Transposase n=1 Tax=Aurantiacibacter xanthus TaxID=1784712 RepID=A0A3A1P1D7_9SPHN|nr:transposase domain-containing protein [Aurantiacibacter xanthus]RIV82977.1 transposase [Aurantiacibacter xanthus]